MRRLLPSLALLLAAGCLVPDVNLEGKACSIAHPCSVGYQCVNSKCLLQDHVPVGDGGAPATDAGSGSDAGIPANQAALTGDLAFPVNALEDRSVLVGGAGNSVTVVLGESPIACANFVAAQGRVIEIDATLPGDVSSFPPGTYPLRLDDGGAPTTPAMRFEYDFNHPDGGDSPTFDSAVGGPGGVSGTVTFTRFAPHAVVGSFDVSLLIADGGASPLQGTFTANDSACP